MQSITDGDSEIAYTYNGDGLRTSKTVNGETTNYYYNGSILAGQKTGDDTLVFMYDNNSDIFGFIYNDTEYYYIKNAQNDVIAIADTDGKVLVKYTYDAWGKIILITDGNNNDITNLKNDISHGIFDIATGESTPVLDENGNPVTEASTSVILARINPILYRSYYYDKETEWYYLNTRYYSPDMCRFINADGYIQTSQGIFDKNMFAYCENNPISRIDDEGNFWHIVVGAVVGAAIGAATEALSKDSNGKTILVSAISGALSGALACTGLGVGALVALNITISAGESFTNQAITKGVENVDYGEVIVDGAISGITTAFGGPGNGNKHLNNLGKQTIKSPIKKGCNEGFKNGVKQNFKEGVKKFFKVGCKKAKKAFSYYRKNTKNYYKTYFTELWKDGGSSALSILISYIRK